MLKNKTNKKRMIATTINDALESKNKMLQNKMLQNKFWIGYSTLNKFVEFFENMDKFELLLFNRKYDTQNIKSHYFCNKTANKKSQTINTEIHCKKIINIFVCELVDFMVDGLMQKIQKTTLIEAVSTVYYFFATLIPTPQIEITICCFIEFAKSKVKWIKIFHSVLGFCFTIDIMHFYVKNNYYTLQTEYITEPFEKMPQHYSKINNELIDEIMDLVLQHLKNYFYFLRLIDDFDEKNKIKLKHFDNSINKLFADTRKEESYAKNTDKELLDFCFYNYFITVWMVYYLQIRYTKNCSATSIEEYLKKDVLFNQLMDGNDNDNEKIFDVNLQYDKIIDNLFDE